MDASSPPAGVLLATIRGSNAAAQALLALVKPYHVGGGDGQGLRQPVAVDDQFEYQILLSPDSNTTHWVLGLGTKTHNNTSDDADFRLRPKLKGRFWDSHVAAIKTQQLQITLNYQTGVIILHSLSHTPTLIMHGDDSDTVDATLMLGTPTASMQSGKLPAAPPTSTSLVLTALKTRFRVGPFDFTIELPWWRSQHQAAVVDMCQKIASRRGYYPSMHIGALSTWGIPSKNGEYWVKPHPEGYPVTGIHCNTGKQSLVHMLTYNNTTFQSVQKTIGNLRRLGGEAETGVLGLRDTWCAHGPTMCWFLQQWQAPGTSSDTLFYSVPSPEGNFDSIRWSQVRTIARLTYFHQTLVGLKKIHDEGMIHGSIGPQALVFVPIEEPSPNSEESDTASHIRRLRAAITNLASATEGPTRHDQPDIASQRRFAAPEVQKSTIQNQYTYSADVWSLALTWLQTFGPLPSFPWPVDRPAYVEIKETLPRRVRLLTTDERVRSEFVSLLKLMIPWRPDGRATATELLRHPLWELLAEDGNTEACEDVGEEDFEGQEDGREAWGEEREDLEEEEREHEQRRKRVRVRSPAPVPSLPDTTPCPPRAPSLPDSAPLLPQGNGSPTEIASFAPFDPLSPIGADLLALL